MFSNERRILVTGGTGLLGVPLVNVLRKTGAVVKSQGRGTHPCDMAVDLCDFKETSRQLDIFQPTCIINLVALTNVDQCELDRQIAYRMNVKTVESLAAWVKRQNGATHLIQISTDQLYDGDGEKTEPEITLANTYAWSKFCAELVATTVGGTCLRTNFFGKSEVAHRVSFTDWAFHAFQTQNPTTLFHDIFFSPLSIETLCYAVQRVVETPIPGTFNLGSRNGMSKADFVISFVSQFGFSTERATLVSGDSVGLKAPRPKDMRMDCRLFEKTFSMGLPNLSEEIERVRKDYDIFEPIPNPKKENRERASDLLHR